MDSTLTAPGAASIRAAESSRDPLHYPDTQFYVSMKGVVLQDGNVLLLRKITGEWDLPGGRLNIQETPKQCLIREIHEETGLSVKPGKLLHHWVRRRPGKVDVFLVSHLCRLLDIDAEVNLSREHDKMGWFTMQEFEALPVSGGVRKSVMRAYNTGK